MRGRRSASSFRQPSLRHYRRREHLAAIEAFRGQNTARTDAVSAVAMEVAYRIRPDHGNLEVQGPFQTRR